MNKLKKHLAPEVIQGFMIFLCFITGYAFTTVVLLFLNSIFGTSECEVFTFDRIWEYIKNAPFIFAIIAITLCQLLQYLSRVNSKFNKIWNFSLFEKLSKYKIIRISYITIMTVISIIWIVITFYVIYLFCTGNICK